MSRGLFVALPGLPPRVPMQAEGGFVDETPAAQTVEEVERELVLRTLAQHRGNRTIAARALGISVRTLRNRIRAYQACGIAVPEPLPKRFPGSARLNRS